MICNKIQLNHIYLIYMYKEDLALNDLPWLICHKTHANQIIDTDGDFCILSLSSKFFFHWLPFIVYKVCDIKKYFRMKIKFFILNFFTDFLQIYIRYPVPFQILFSLFDKMLVWCLYCVSFSQCSKHMLPLAYYSDFFIILFLVSFPLKF